MMKVYKPTSTCIGHRAHWLVQVGLHQYVEMSIECNGQELMFNHYEQLDREPNPSFWTYVGEYQEYPPELF